MSKYKVEYIIYGLPACKTEVIESVQDFAVDQIADMMNSFKTLLNNKGLDFRDIKIIELKKIG